MRPTRRRALVLAAASLALLLAGGAARARDPGAPCREGGGVAIWTSPGAPGAGAPLRILAVAETDTIGDLEVRDPDGRAVAVAVIRRSGPPWSLAAAVERPVPGTYRVEVVRDGAALSCRAVEVARVPGRSAGAARGAVWESRLAWDRATEAFYSAWIEQLFDAPPEVSLGFRPLHEALRDPGRNFLHDHLGLGEDDARSPRALVADPDCADLPYFLRAYFAWKVGLPVGFRACSRGSATAPPRCGALVTNEQPPRAQDPLAAFQAFARRLMDTVHSGSARTALADEATDFYPVPVERDVLRPGIVFADPYGHALMLVKWVPQTGERSGLLLAVDAQPDASVGRKRFWEGTFLFASDTPGAGPGFKAFRPLVGGGGALRPLSNAALAGDPRFAPFSAEQARMSADELYARMARLINPRGLDPLQAYEETLDALVEQLETRVQSVDNGEEHVRATRGAIVPMPEGARIFETVGPWEDYSTPSRDMRLIIAMNVLAGLPERIVRHPELYVLGDRRPEEARAEVERLHARRAAERTITYTRSDGSPWRLTVADVLARKPAFEVAYNPNDCVEVRWGAPEGTAEHATCRRRAPVEQRARMEQYRPWFREARRPPRP
jgi:hypothetical protein